MIYPGSKRVVVASVIAAFTWSGAHAHGIAGNRFFVGTLTFDDPVRCGRGCCAEFFHAQ